MPNSNIADVIVIGLGAVGGAALYQAAKLKAHVIGIDRFAPPHEHGSSHGDTRITRRAIGEGREFVPLVLRSDEIWNELEETTGRTLVTRNGGLILASRNMPGDHHGSTSFVQDTIDAAREFAIAHEVLDAAEIAKRYPQFRLRGDEVGYFEPDAGFLRPERCIETQLDLSRDAGARVLVDEVATTIEAGAHGLEVQTNRGRYSAAQVIVTAGAWIPQLIGEEYAGLFRVYRQTLCWFAIGSNHDRYTPQEFPIFIWITGNQPRDMMYGFPAVDGPNGGVKISTEQYEATVHPDSVSRDVASGEIAAMHAEYIAARFPDVSSQVLRTETCLYTVTPDAKFIIDKMRGDDRVWFASACSGHGFKHSAAVGEALARQALGQPAIVDLSMFGLARFAKQVRD
jgi:sarcosine oxidase